MRCIKHIIFSQRIRYLVLVILTLLPIVSILLLVFITASMPVFRGLESLTNTGINEMYPLRTLQVSILHAVMPPNDYLIHGSESEKLMWQEMKQEVEQALSELLEKSASSPNYSKYKRLDEKWKEAELKGDGLFRTPVLKETNAVLAAEMEEFDRVVKDISDLIELHTDKLSEETIYHHNTIEKSITHGIILSGAAIISGFILGMAGAIWLTRDRKKIVSQALRDPLTKAYNRRAIDRELEKMKKRCKGSPGCSILLLDLDKFKNINDTYGHDTGDIVLQRFARLINETIRSSDIFGRFGGEEFIVLLPETSRDDAYMLGERIRQNTEMMTVKLNDGEKISITVSIGCSSFSENDVPADEILKTADKALYKAKNNGRNQVISL